MRKRKKRKVSDEAVPGGQASVLENPAEAGPEAAVEALSPAEDGLKTEAPAPMPAEASIPDETSAQAVAGAEAEAEEQAGAEAEAIAEAEEEERAEAEAIAEAEAEEKAQAEKKAKLMAEAKARVEALERAKAYQEEVVTMQHELIFGAAYYEEYLPEDRLERDMALMAEAGLNTVRIAESTWSVTEPEEGRFDFSHITRVAEAAARHGLSVIVGTPTYAIPPWLAKLAPDILGGNLYGPRQNFDITNPTYLQYAERIIRETVKRTAGLPNVIGYQIDNETKGLSIPGKSALNGFRAWLRDRFKTVDALNSAYCLRHWSNSVTSFDELPDPTGAANPGYACAFEEYRRALAAGFLKWQAGLVASLKRPDQFITHNFDYDWKELGDPGVQEGCSLGLQPDINQYDAAKALTLVGTDIYTPAAAALTGQEIFFGGDLMRPLRRDNYLVLESQAQAFTGWLPYPGQLRLMALSHVSSGAAGLMYWPWLSIHGGKESYWKGVLSHDGEPGPEYEEIKETGALLREFAGDFCRLRKKNAAAMVVSAEALHALRRFPTAKGLSYNDVLREFYGAMYEMNLECDILYDRDSDWSGYSLLIFPQLYCAGEALISRVRAFVAGGGTVLASFRSFFADENMKIYPDRQPHGLTEIFGMHYSRFTRDENGVWMELLEPKAAAVAGRYTHPYWGGYAAATRSRFGKGWAWYLGTLPEREELKSFLRRVCETAEINLPPQGFPIVCRRAVTRENRRLCFVFNYSGQDQNVRCPAAGTDLLTGLRRSLGDDLVLRAWDAMIIKEEE